MRMRSVLAVAAIVLWSVAVPAAEMHMQMSPADSPAVKAFMAANGKMMTDMVIQPTGNPDRDFLTMMIPHHQGAIDMAKIELEYGKDPQTRALAEAIVAAQEKEIAQMTAWLATLPP